AGTNPATQFIGTTDDQPFEVRANNTRVARIEPRNGVRLGPNVLLGYEGNSVIAGVGGATVGGGGLGLAFGYEFPNRATGHYGTVSGGLNNRAGDYDNDPVTGAYATVGGGRDNSAIADYATVSGGIANYASGIGATV